MEQTTIELLRKYDRPGPRYTSYPTAPEWSERFTRHDYLSALAEAAADVDSPISLYVHIPFCPRRCYFCGCTSVITNKRENIDRYLAAVEKELAAVREALGKRHKIIQLHWGG
jgi:oxygen-independent coproporphyrinogen-3 oxidase